MALLVQDGKGWLLLILTPTLLSSTFFNAAKIAHAKDLELGGNVMGASGDVDKSSASIGSPASASLKRFPDRLYELLNIEAAPESLYWLPGGKAFAIEQENFSSQVLDRYFQATKFSSFVRRLHKW